MKERSVFHLISDITKQKGVPCVLIGGFAVNFHKYTRQTNDIDILITREDFEKISHFIIKAGYKEIANTDAFVQFKSTKLSLMDVDFGFVDQETLTNILKEGKEFYIAKQKFIVPSLNHLIALKLHALKSNFKNRLLKDFQDVAMLIKNNQVDVRSASFKDMCLKYGTQEIYDRFLEVF